MSDRDMLRNAKSKGRRAWWKGVPLNQNPMRSLSSRLAWAEGWEEERKEIESRRAARSKYGPEAVKKYA